MTWKTRAVPPPKGVSKESYGRPVAALTDGGGPAVGRPGSVGVVEPGASGMTTGYWNAGDVLYATAKVRTREGLVVRHVPVACGPEYLRSAEAMERAKQLAVGEAERRRGN